MDNETNEEYIFLVEDNQKHLFWVDDDQISSSVVDAFSVKYEENNYDCNTIKERKIYCRDKQTTCGVLTLCSNCGFIGYWNDIYGAESPTQVCF